MYLRLFTYGECITIKNCLSYEYLINGISIIYDADADYIKRNFLLKDIANSVIVNELNFKFVIYRKKGISLKLDIIKEEDYSLDLELTKNESKLTNILIQREHMFCSICKKIISDYKVYKCLSCRKYQCIECKGLKPNITSNNHSLVEMKRIFK